MFVALNQSVRSVRTNLSFNLMVRNRAASRLKKFGPERMYLPTSPNVVLPNRSDGSPNADVLNHGRVLMPYSFWKLPTCSGDWLFPGVLIEAQLQPKFSGVPVMKVTTPLTCQPPNSAAARPVFMYFCPFPNGS